MATVIQVPGVEKLSAANLRALADAARVIGVPVDWLATIISFESAGSFDPSKPNAAGSGAFGLIQFLPSTAAGLLGGTSSDAAARGKAMSFNEQLEKMVIPYFKNFGTAFHSLQDMYLAVFYPKAMNRPANYVIGTAPSKVYTQNAGFDKDGKGFITKTDVTSGITHHYERAGGAVSIPGNWFQIMGGLVVAGAALYAAQKFLPPEYRMPEYKISRRYLQPLTELIHGS
jgi:hypothetical protein